MLGKVKLDSLNLQYNTKTYKDSAKAFKAVFELVNLFGIN